MGTVEPVESAPPAIRTSPLFINVAVWWWRAPAIAGASAKPPPAPELVPDSAELSVVEQVASVHPPATRTVPSPRSVARARAR